MFQNQEFVKALEDSLEAEIHPIKIAEELDGIFFVDPKSCIILLHYWDSTEGYQKLIMSLVKIIIKQSLQNSKILILFLLEEIL